MKGVTFEEIPDGCVFIAQGKKFVKIKGEYNAIEIGTDKTGFFYPETRVELVKQCTELDHERFWYGNRCVLCVLRAIEHKEKS